MAALPQGIRRSPTVDAIYQRAYVDNAWSGQSWRISMSDIGNPCDRAIYDKLRWARPPETFDGQTLRLFKTGHLAEARLIEDLQIAGVDVDSRDPKTKRQYEVLLAGGHLRGKVDGIASGFVEAPVVKHVLECKSSSEKNFRALLKSGVAVAKPEHVDTMQLYMHGLGLTRAAYVVVNKNDDELHIERLEADPVHAARLIARAEDIVTAEARPLPLHEDPEAKMAFRCRSCPSLGICHGEEWAPRNCRTCLHSTALLDGKGSWKCERYDRLLTIEDQNAGCGAHLYVPGFVPGKQVDSNEAEEWIDYDMPDGTTWRDGAEPPLLTGLPTKATPGEVLSKRIADAVEGDEVAF